MPNDAAPPVGSRRSSLPARPGPVAGLGVLTGLLAPGGAFAANSPFGVGLTDGPGGGSFNGPFGGFFGWVALTQSEFYRQLTDALDAMKADGRAFWVLAGVSFVYGVFHAAGPGHGKAVVTSYMLATGEGLRRGILISFAAAMLQSTTAVVLVAIAALLFNATAMTMTAAAYWLEIGSYALIAAVGATLLWRSITSRGHANAHAGASGHDHDDHDHHHDHDHSGHDPAGHDHHDHAPAIATVNGHDHSGHSHMPEPAALTGPLTFAKAWSAVAAVGLRPCSGAIIVLVFALAQQLFVAGIVSTYLMGVGTGLTVALLATLAVFARSLAIRFAGEGSGRAARLIRAVQIVSGALVLIFGLSLVAGALATHGNT